MKIGDRVRINSRSAWRNAFGVIVEVATGVVGVRLIQPTRRPSYTNKNGRVIYLSALNIILLDIMVVRVP